jgi:Ca-activated chloride channel homolog
MNAALRHAARAGALGLAVVLAAPFGVAARPRVGSPESARMYQAGSTPVSLAVAVTDKSGQPVSGLRKEDFRVDENGVAQTVTFFSTEPGPVSWGIVIDRSSKVLNWKGKEFADAAVRMVGSGTRDDEVFVLGFADQVQTLLDFTTDRTALANAIPAAPQGGGAAQYDAIAAGLDRFKSARHAKKVLLVVATGDDTASRINFSELASRVEGSGVIIHSPGIFKRLIGKERISRGGYPDDEIRRLAELTGGTANIHFSMKACVREMAKIGLEVSRLYTLGYTSTNTNAPGKWRKVRVEVERAGALGKYDVRTQSGYHGSSETAAK